MITPRDFVDRWAHSQLREQQAAQSHFNELCQLVGYKTPTELDPEGTFFTFEEQVTKATGGKGRADVWYKGKFAWEYKGKHRDLDDAYAQLLAYKGDLDNPPLLVVCDFLEYRIYPQWPNTSGLPFVFHNEDLLRPEYQKFITWLLESPDQFLALRQSELEQREKITLDLAFKFAHLADLMRQQSSAEGQQVWQPLQIARFLTKVVFALFAEDIGLLPVIANAQPALRFVIEGAKRAPHEFVPMLRSLFEAMDGEHYFMMYYVPYFNGGIFRDSQADSKDGYEVLDVTLIPGAINLLEEVSDKDWRFVNPTIFGTLFEGALDVSKRAQLGAHYTGESDIQLVVEPVLMQPLKRQWQIVEVEAQPLMQVYLNRDLPPRPVHEAGVKLQALYEQMMTSLSQTRVLDPACGSGNFLYMSLRAMKDLEGRVRRVFEPLQLPYPDAVTPRQLYGIEKDEFAANLAKVVVWIGYLQWRYEDEGGVLHYANPRKSGEHPRQLPNPILKDKNSPDESDRIVCDDAILRYGSDGKPYEPTWPEADVIMGNPPFLGGNRIRGELGGYVDDLFGLYDERVPAFADLVCYWYEKARTQIESDKAKRAGLLATNSIRGGVNREVLSRIKDTGDIFMAWSDRKWVLEGAAVRISIVGFDERKESTKTLDGNVVPNINSDLTGSTNIVQAKPLNENVGIGFRGNQKGGAFDIPADVAQKFKESSNPSGRSNQDIIKPWWNGLDITGRPRNMWLIDFGTNTTLEDASLYESPLAYVRKHVKPDRDKNPVKSERENWWLPLRGRPEMRTAIAPLRRFLVTPHVSKHRLWVWLDREIIPDHQTIVVARDSDYFFGVLHSYLHETWALRLGTSLEDRPRYTPTTTFETFPFPWSPGKEDTASPAYAAISAAAKQLHEERETWLNPPDLIALGADSKALKERTLTNLYNALVAHRAGKPNGEKLVKPARDFAPRLAHLHDALDAAVLAAYSWDDLIPPSLYTERGTGGEVVLRTPDGDEELLRRLLALNLQRAASND